MLKGSIPTVARHIFQACPVWIYTQSNITNIILNSPLIFHLTYELYCRFIYVEKSYSSVGQQYTQVGQTVNLSFTYVGQNVQWFPIYVGQFHEWVGQCPWPTDILRPEPDGFSQNKV
jgi:hypothetical protein